MFLAAVTFDKRGQKHHIASISPDTESCKVEVHKPIEKLIASAGCLIIIFAMKQRMGWFTKNMEQSSTTRPPKTRKGNRTRYSIP
jgi:hypothetical protein